MSPQRPIRLLDAVKFTKNEPHQLAAWNWLESVLTKEQLDEFALLFRATPGPKPGISTENSWDGITAAAKHAGAAFPELVAAQWALESGWGKHMPGGGSNNPFGLKGSGTSSETREFVNGEWITITDSFLNFPNLATAVQYLVDRWYRDYRNFKGVNRERTRDVAARALVRENYATAPDYAERLIALMNENAPVSKLPGPVPFPNPLRVPFYSQRDSTVAGQAMRMCFSSSCAMLIAALRPGAISGPDADDQYLKRVRQFGDTTDATAQLRALRSYGIVARFTQTADWADIERQILRGVPVPAGFLHKGPSSNPAGGGHWLTVIGFTKTAVIVNDPFGDMDVVQGVYLSSRGAGLAYSRKNWGPRWLVEGPRSGWAILVDP